MTIKQIQNLLQFLGYYEGIPDGEYGPLTAQATENFQLAYKGIAVDGIPGEQTQKALRDAVAYGIPIYEAEKKPDGDFWNRVRYFTREEFRCACGKCGGFPVEPKEEMVLAVDEIRHRMGVPVQIVDAGGSGVRCKEHNDSIPNAAKNSQHLYGLAADLHSSKSPEEMYRVAEEVLGNTGGIGLYSWGIHVDTRPVKSRWKG